jgi:hypothetical protein
VRNISKIKILLQSKTSLTPSLLREATYSTVRMGGYDLLKDIFSANDPRATSLMTKIFAGGLSGSIGAAFANPTG